MAKFLTYPTLLSLSVLLAACATGQDQADFRPPPLTPAPVGSVSSSSLPPVIGTVPQAGLAGAPGAQAVDGVATGVQDLQAIPDISRKTGVVASQDVSVGPDIEFGRNAVLGAWNVASEQDACAMNLSLTTWTGGFRASTRGCVNEGLAQIGAWQLAGKQLTLLDAEGGILARLFPSGPNRFDGTTETGLKAISVFR